MIATHMQPILIITGIVTTLAAVMFIAHRFLLELLFKMEGPDSITLFVVRHWGLLIGLVGVLLVFAAYEPSIRVPGHGSGHSGEKRHCGADFLYAAEANHSYVDDCVW